MKIATTFPHSSSVEQCGAVWKTLSCFLQTDTCLQVQSGFSARIEMESS